MTLPDRMACGVYLTTANASRVPWGAVEDHVKQFQRKLMVAALKQMREPTEAMLVAGSGWIADRALLRNAWTAMVDAELPR